MTSKLHPEAKEIPEILYDSKTRKRYVRGRFLGKGGFAKCYELTDKDTNEVFAGKIVPKSLLVKAHQRDKMTQEIHIHRSVSHPHIVKFYHHFEDSDFVYVLLELCRRRSLMELHKRRKAITEPEARYFVRQTLLAVQYLHDNRVIHRDLKLGNLFLNDEMDVKIGDFGLATSIEFEGERKKTLCGTPNYIAPEVLCKKGHSFEVDVWSLGCIVYTLLVGKPPFETSSLKDTYLRIKKNEYHLPSRLSPMARNLIQRLLQSNPDSRPSVRQMLDDEFFTSGFLPAKLPTSCLTMAPRIDTLQRYDLQHSTQHNAQHRRPFYEINGHATENPVAQRPMTGHGFGVPKTSREQPQRPATALQRLPSDEDERRNEPADCYLSELLTMLTSVCKKKPSSMMHANEDEAEDPASIPVYWISKWVDYSDKYGLGYQLCDNSMGVLFNDSTRLLLFQNEETTEYIERDGREHFHTASSYPEALSKKYKLLKYFREYMSEHLIKTGAHITPREADEMSRLPFLRTWFRTRSAIILHLSNGTIQINWFEDHAKIILCPLMKAVTYINPLSHFKVFSASKIETFGCSVDLEERLQYAKNMVSRLISTRSSSARQRAAATGSAAAPEQEAAL